MSIEKRLERIEAILDARGLDWDHPMVASDHFADANKMVVEEPSKEQAEEPPKKWRILGVGEEVQEGDWYADAFYPRQCWPPSKGAWFEVKADPVKVGEAATSGLVFARPVVEETAKAEPAEPEYREPVLPADAGKVCEFSDNGSSWASGRLGGWRVGSNWISTGGVCWAHARIKKDA